jgi:hypothetical protein
MQWHMRATGRGRKTGRPAAGGEPDTMDEDRFGGTPNPILKQAFAYWDGRRKGRPMPARRDIDPLDIPHLLPWLMLTDVLRSPLDFRYRLIGTGIVSRSRRDFTGSRLSELPHAGPGSMVWRHRREVVETGRPVFAIPPYTGADAAVQRVMGIHMPLSEDAEMVNMILTVVAYEHG